MTRDNDAAACYNEGWQTMLHPMSWCKKYCLQYHYWTMTISVGYNVFKSGVMCCCCFLLMFPCGLRTNSCWAGVWLHKIKQNKMEKIVRKCFNLIASVYVIVKLACLSLVKKLKKWLILNQKIFLSSNLFAITKNRLLRSKRVKWCTCWPMTIQLLSDIDAFTFLNVILTEEYYLAHFK